MPGDERQTQVEKAVAGLTLPGSVGIRAWLETDFAAIQQLSTATGWPTPVERPYEALNAWGASWPTLVLVNGPEVIGFLRALTDGQVTTYIAEVLVSPQWRGQGLGQALIETCHRLCPSTRLDLLSTESSDGFYEAVGFRHFPGFRRSIR
jgi:GNAT superfamily N-acetyltransferase